MERSYTNSEGISIVVDEIHLNMAVDIKLELQELTPSRKCNWKKHKEMMIESGFNNSDTSETYRCMIKDYQKSIGRLASVAKYAELVSESKLDAVKNAVGKMFLEKRETQLIKNDLNKLKRELSLYAIISDEIRNAFIDECSFSFDKNTYEHILPSGGDHIVAVLTDWHIGATVDSVNGNDYNYEIALKRLNKYKKELFNYCKLFKVTNVTVVCLGDMTENVSMRKINQAFEAELNFSQQIVKATKLIQDFIMSVSQYSNVSYVGISGNHDRLQDDSKDRIDGDNTMVIINESVKMFIELIDNPRITYEKCTDENLYEHKKIINGVSFKFLHGDLDSKSNSKKLESHALMDEEFYDVIVFGHYHHYELIERNYGKFEMYVGSPMGRNNYSKKIKSTSDASQSIILVKEDKTTLPIYISLQEV